MKEVSVISRTTPARPRSKNYVQGTAIYGGGGSKDILIPTNYIRDDQDDGTNYLLYVGTFLDSMKEGTGIGLFPEGRAQADKFEARKQIQIGEAMLFWDDANKAIGIKRVAVPASEDGTGEIKESEIGVYSQGWMSAKGIDKGEEEGTGGATTIGQLVNVGAWADQTPAYDRIMVQLAGSTHWTEKRLDEIGGGLDEEQLAAYLTENNYAKKTDIPSLEGYATETWVTNKGYITSAALTGYATQSWVLGKNYATTSDLDARIDALVNGAPAAYDTLKEIADVLQGNVDSIGDIITTLGTKADKTITITAGTGLTGGGNLSANRTISLKPATTTALGGIIVGDRLSIDSSGKLTATYTYTHPSATATTISAATGKVLSAITVNNLGHVTSVAAKTLAAADIPTLSISKISGLQEELDSKLEANVFNDLFEKVEIRSGVYAIRAKYGLYSNEFISAKGIDSGTGGSTGVGNFFGVIVNGSTYRVDDEGYVTIPDYPTSLNWSEINGKPSWIGSSKPSYAWSEITGKPSSFTPSSHTHTKADITNFPSTWAWANITGKPSTLSGYGITANDVLNTLKTVDGSGSGLNSDTLDGYNSNSFESYKLVEIDASTLDNDTWFPVTMSIGNSLQTRIRIEGRTSANASWNTRADKEMALILDYTVNGSYWGWTNVSRIVYQYIEGEGTSSCLAGLGQLTNSSTEYVFVRGGAKYNFYVSRFITPVLRTSTYTVNSQSVSPTTSKPKTITVNNALKSSTVAAADKLTVNAGSNTNPIYFSGGVPKASSYSFGNSSGNIPISNGTLCTNLNADKLDGIDVTANSSTTGIKKLYVFNHVGNQNTYIKLGTLPTVASTASGTSKVKLRIYGGINFGGGEEATWEVIASTRGTIYVNSTLVNGAKQLKIGYVSTSSGVEIWAALDDNYATKTAIEIEVSEAFTVAMTRQTTKPTGFTEGSYRILADTEDNVASATKLQTARTINATSFDGTENITTVQWGTTRNIGIVNSDGTGTAVTVPVNGGANVNLKLPSTIKASLNGNATTATTLQTARTIWGQSFNGSANVSGAISGATTINASGAVTFGSTLAVTGLITATAGLTTTQYLQIGDGRIYWDSTNKALYVKHKDGTTAIGFYSLGWMSAKGVDSGTGGSTGGGNFFGVIVNGSTYRVDDEGYVTIPDYPTSLNWSEISGKPSWIGSTKPSYAWSEITGKPSSFTPSSHTHTKSQISDFPTTWAWGSISGKPTTLAGYGITDGVNAVTVSGSGNAVTSASISGHKLTLTKGSTFLLSSQYTANDILTKLKTVDGEDSGLDADTLDGYNASTLYSNGYIMFEHTIDASELDEDTYYPVTFSLTNFSNVRIECIVGLNSGTTPSWSTHARGFSVRKIWESNGSGWGVNPVNRRILVSDFKHASSDPVRGIGQLTNSSTEYIYVRGGGIYILYTSHNISPILRTSAYTTNKETISPTTSAPAEIVRNVAFKTDTVSAADKLTTNAGSNTNPIYFTGGIPKASSYSFGNASGNIAINNGILNVNLNADLFDGVHLDGLLTSVTSKRMANLSITVGGTTKTVSDLYAAYTEKLLTARTIWGQTFDGTANVSGALTGVTNITASGSITAQKMYITGTANSNAYITADTSYNMYFVANGLSLLSLEGSQKAVRSGSGYASQISLGTATVRWSNLYSVAGNFSGDITANRIKITDTDAVRHIEFSRTSYNYLTAPAGTDSSINFIVNGQDLLIANADLSVRNGLVCAGTTNATSLGNSTYRWSGLYSVLGNFSGAVTIGNGLNVTGNIVATGAITAKAVSDIRLKTVIQEEVDYRKKLLGLGSVVDFYYNDKAIERNTGAVDKQRHIGLIYQQAKTSKLVNFCHEDEYGFGSINYLSTDYINLIAGALQQTIVAQETIEQRVARLERENKDLKIQLNKLSA